MAVAVEAAPSEGLDTPAWRVESARVVLAHAIRPERAILLAILVVQAALSYRLIHHNTAFLDEATYLISGHEEIAHFLHHVPIPHYAPFLSGAPVVYPVLAAMVDSVFGLTGARLLSLVFMLVATTLLHGITRRLFDRWAAAFAAAGFAAMGSTQFLGIYATYDAMALMLMAVGGWFAVRASRSPDAAWLLVGATAAMAAANATKYASALFDPVIIGLAVTAAVPLIGWRAAVKRGVGLLLMTVAAVGGLLLAGGSLYYQGLMQTTVNRVHGTTPALTVLTTVLPWCLPIVAAAWAGALLRLGDRAGRADWVVPFVLAVAGLLAPADQAHIGSTQSLFKHVDFGAWFSAAAAGYALARLTRLLLRFGALRAVAAIAAAAAVGMAGADQAYARYGSWANSSQLTTDMRTLTASTQGRILEEEDYIEEYYQRDHVPWWRWRDTWSLTYTPPGGHSLTGQAAYISAIQHHYFSVIVLDHYATPGLDAQVQKAIKAAGGYHVGPLPSADTATRRGVYRVWVLDPGYTAPPASPPGNSAD